MKKRKKEKARAAEEAILIDYRDQNVVILGFARQGKALTRFFASAGARVIVSDLRPANELKNEMMELSEFSLQFELEQHPRRMLENASVLFLSGGVPADIPIVAKAKEMGIRVSNDSQLFLELTEASVIGITGSAGKSTTTALVAKMAEAEFANSDRRAWVGGNLGRPLLEDVHAIHKQDLAIIEFSSFQLELMNLSPKLAAILNITPNHLDRHKNMQAYVAAKKRILLNQTSNDIAILNREDPRVWELRDAVRGDLFTFGLKEAGVEQGTFVREEGIWLRQHEMEIHICSVDEIALRGAHNLANVAAASAIAAAANFSVESISSGIRNFEGISHRLEFIRNVADVDWYNDSIATSPERAIAAIIAFEKPLVLLAGGRDKNLPWDGFAKQVVERVKHLILFGEARELIEGAVRAHLPKASALSIQIVEKFGEAVKAASKVASPGDIVLLAPGATSFDEFRDFAERGDLFRQMVEDF